MRKIDLTGQKFNKLTVLSREPDQVSKAGNKQKRWLCKCDCGTVKVINQSNIKSGTTKSCGCHKEEVNGTHKMSNTKEYSTWCDIKRRCNNPKNKAYKHYGAKGIKVCPEWENNFEQFYADMGNCPDPKYSIDRIDNNKGYCASNCRWANQTTQVRNRGVSRANNSGVKGVYWSERAQKWKAQITANYKRHHLGTFEKFEDAVQARLNAEEKYW